MFCDKSWGEHTNNCSCSHSVISIRVSHSLVYGKCINSYDYKVKSTPIPTESEFVKQEVKFSAFRYVSCDFS